MKMAKIRVLNKLKRVGIEDIWTSRFLGPTLNLNRVLFFLRLTQVTMFSRILVKRVSMKCLSFRMVRNFSKETSQNSNTRGPVTLASLAITAAVGVSLILYYNVQKDEKIKSVTNNVVTSTGKPALGGPWSLVDHNGVPRTDASYRGKLTLLYFGFTHCPDICPSELVKVAKIMNELGQSGASTTCICTLNVDDK
jgi:hypothetical protein